MMLFIEDITESPVAALDLDRIEASVTFPDGTVRHEIFRPLMIPTQRYYQLQHRLRSKRRSTYSLKEDWIETTAKFALNVGLPFKGQVDEVEFEYKAPRGTIAYHRR